MLPCARAARLGRRRARGGLRPPALPLGRDRGRGRARPTRSLRPGTGALQLRSRAATRDAEGARLQPALRGARLAVDPHGRRDRDRRHAVPDRFGQHRAEPSRVRGPPDHPPRAHGAPRRGRGAAGDPPPAPRRGDRRGGDRRVRDSRRGGQADGPREAARARAAPRARDRRGPLGGRGLARDAQPGARRGGRAPQGPVARRQRGRGGGRRLPRLAGGAQLHLPRLSRVRRARL